MEEDIWEDEGLVEQDETTENGRKHRGEGGLGNVRWTRSSREGVVASLAVEDDVWMEEHECWGTLVDFANSRWKHTWKGKGEVPEGAWLGTHQWTMSGRREGLETRSGEEAAHEGRLDSGFFFQMVDQSTTYLMQNISEIRTETAGSSACKYRKRRTGSGGDQRSSNTVLDWISGTAWEKKVNGVLEIFDVIFHYGGARRPTRGEGATIGGLGALRACA